MNTIIVRTENFIIAFIDQAKLLIKWVKSVKTGKFAQHLAAIKEYNQIFDFDKVEAVNCIQVLFFCISVLSVCLISLLDNNEFIVANISLSLLVLFMLQCYKNVLTQNTTKGF